MSKSSNKMQAQLLIHLMEGQPGIASGFAKGEKSSQAAFWRKVEMELNAVGPPSKTICEWKKVWSDQKRYVRQKAAENSKARKGTGGGPNKEKKLSPNEQAIFNLIGMESYVEGVPSKKLGFQKMDDIEASFSEVEMQEVEIDDIIEEESFVEIVEPIDTAEASSSLCTHPKKISAAEECSPLPKCTKRIAAAALNDEIKIQTEMCSHIKTAVSDLKQQCSGILEISTRLDNIYNQNQTHHKECELLMKEANLIQKEKLQEIKRHNSFMEGMKRKEIENKRLEGKMEINQC